MTQTDIEFDLGAVAMHCTAEEVADAFAGLLHEMRVAAPFVTADERTALRWIMAHASGTLTVGSVFPDFARDTAALTALRRLRTAQFIRPAGRDHWDRDEFIAIKPFARLVWDRLGEDAIFAPDAESHTPAPADDIDLSLPDVDAPESKETVLLKHTGAEKWEDDDVLDFLSESKVGAR